jgi:hypothetical protein
VASIPGATAASVAASGTGGIAVAATPAGLVSQPFDVSGAAIAPSTLSAGAFASVDVTAIDAPAASATGDMYAVVAGTAGDLLLTVPGATASTLLGSYPVLHDLLASFDGSHVAVASARSTVAVTWLNANALEAGESTGGWALLACR